MRRPTVSLIMLLVVSLVLLPADSNIAANALPPGWRPYLWLAWPIGGLLAIPLILWEARKHRSSASPAGDNSLDQVTRDAADGAESGELSAHQPAQLAMWLDRQLGLKYHRFEQRYRNVVSMGLRHIDQKGLATVGPYTPQLDDVFVELSVTPSPPHDVPSGVVSDAPTASLERHPLSDFLDQDEPALLAIVGGPGMGKTSELLHSARQLCHASSGRRTVPILLYLRDHVTRILDSPDMCIADVVRATLGDERAAEPPGWFEWHLVQGNCVVHLDGLDEVATQAGRRALADWVERQVRRFPKNDYVITSRPHGYLTARIHGATVLRMLRMTDCQVERFTQRWYRAYELAAERYHQKPTDKKNAGEEAAAMRAAAGARDLLESLANVPALYALTANPMLLTMIMNVHRHLGELPDTRIDLYDEICRVMLGRRDEAKKLPVVLAVDKKETVLRHLAFDMMQRRVRDVRLADASGVIEPTLRRVSDQLSVSDFLHDLGHSGYLVERENDLYAFAHQTFQEYLAAAHIKDKGLVDVLTDAVDDVWWRETTLLYAARSDTDPIIKACLKSDSVTALSLAFDCEAQSSEIAPQLRERLRGLLRSALDPKTNEQRRRLMAGVMVNRHLRRGITTAGMSRICAQPVPVSLYRLYLMDTGSQPWNEPWLVKPGDEQPIRGVYGREAAAFARWANAVTGGERVCRLPTRAEIEDPVVSRAVTASAQHDGDLSIWVRSDTGPGLELWTSAGGVHPYTVDGAMLAEHVAVDVDSIVATLAGLLLVESAILLPALAKARAIAVATAKPLPAEPARELTRALRVAGELDPSLDLTRALELVGQLAGYQPHGRARGRGMDDLPRAIAISHNILPSDSSGRLAPPSSHAHDTASAGDSARGTALAHDLIRLLIRTLQTVRARITGGGPGHTLSADLALAQGIGLADALDRLLVETGGNEETLPSSISRHPVLSRCESARAGLDPLVGHLLSRALCGVTGEAGRRDRRTGPAEVGERVVGVAGVLARTCVVSPDRLAKVLTDALERLRNGKTGTASARVAWPLTEVADRLESIARPVFTWQRTLAPGDATGIRLAALCLAVEVEDDDQKLGEQFREIAAGVTLLERRTDDRAPLTETIALAIV